MEGLIDGRDVGAEVALEILRQMRTKAGEMGLALSGVVTDRGGHVVASLKMDGAPLGALPIAADKAYTSALWGMRTGEAAEPSLPGNGDWGFATTLGGRMIVFAGGVPIFHDGVQVGAFGISGGTSAEDEECALASLQAAGLG